MSETQRTDNVTADDRSQHHDDRLLPVLEDVDRRRFLEVMASSMALAGAGGCMVSPPAEEIVPYVRAPENIVPGKPRYYATAIALGGYATGVLVESHQGRPTRIEGNPEHAASLGGVDCRTQAAILSLYDPDRSQAVTSHGEIRTWDELVVELEAALERQNEKQGAGIRVLTETVTSPTVAGQLERLLQRYPGAKWVQYESINTDNALAAARQAFGRDVETRYRFDRADVVVSLDADFLFEGPGCVRYARDFMSRRAFPSRVAAAEGALAGRLYVVETGFTSTGAVADHRLPLRPGSVPAAARYLAAAVAGRPSQLDELSERTRQWLDAAAVDLSRHKGSGLVLAGPWQPPEVHTLAHAINLALGNSGNTVEYTRPVVARPTLQVESLRALVNDMAQGNVDLLLIAGGNPVYDAPADVPLAEAMSKVPLNVRLGLYDDETSAHCDWHVPAAHELESWSDARAYDGTATILQPLIDPLYGGKTVHELLAVLLSNAQQTSRDEVREHWRQAHGDDGFERFWRDSLHDGVVAGSRFEPLQIESDQDSPAVAHAADSAASSSSDSEAARIEVTFRPDPSIHDGRLANNAWLQELPKPVTKLTWDNAALISPRTAERLGVAAEQVIELSSENRQLTVPVWIVPGHADDAVTVHLGYGRTRAGRVGNGQGSDAGRLRTSDAFWFVRGVAVRPTEDRRRLACTQQHHRMEGRELARLATWLEYQADPHLAHAEGAHAEASLYGHDGPSGDDYAWGMSINLNSCTGCNACVIACQAENNIPTVGKDQVLGGREMHWIRVDHYFLGEGDDIQAIQQPVACVHCENAPCEVVCPVAATVHGAEGLNEMVYNRCVGTRYCSNNCPYKVRRFNFLQYVDDQTPVLKLLRNPDVTVRTRGVMEKCSYCVQRINAARIEAKKANRRIADGEVVTACQSVCPTRAIEFGNIADPQSRVSQARAHPLSYGLLAELNTRPRTTHMARISNPNPDLTG